MSVIFVSGNQHYTKIVEASPNAVSASTGGESVPGISIVKGFATPTVADTYKLVDSKGFDLKIREGSLVLSAAYYGPDAVGGTSVAVQSSSDGTTSGTDLGASVATLAEIVAGTVKPSAGVPVPVGENFLSLTTLGTFTSGTVAVTLVISTVV